MSRDVMVVIGTRPEAIKMAPVVLALKRRPAGRTILCATAQHREMLDQAMELFGLKPDIDLNLMTPGQDLATLTARALCGVRDAIRQTRPDTVLVHGDTTTCLAGGLAAFYERVPIGHVEAGLRTYDLGAPWPEEMNRRVIDPLCHWCFAPTMAAASNLRGEHIPEERIVVTGNTAIDALNLALKMVAAHPPVVPELSPERLRGKRLVLVTGHRRESFGAAFESLCYGLRDVADLAEDVVVAYPVHMNPNVQAPVRKILSGHPRVLLLPPVSYLPFVWLMWQSTIIITDSGGIQEEAPTLGKPVLVMRETTERPEAVEAGLSLLVGTDRHRILAEARRLLTDPAAYKKMSGGSNPYGDGHSAARIVDCLAS